RRHGEVLGYPDNFTILDRADAEGILNLLRSSLDLAGRGRRFPGKRALADIFGRAVNRNQSIEEVVFDQYPHFEPYLDDILKLARQYRAFKLDHGLMDYDDLLVNWRRLMEEHAGVAATIAGQFHHVLVDEYQDTNHLQAAIVRHLAAGHGNVMAVGDDAQSIYSFRGADFRNIMAFPRLFPDTTIIRLEENYRSTNAILSVANAVIAKAAERYEKHLFTRKEGGDKPVVFAARNEGEQARYVAEQVAALAADGADLAEIAVLFRSGYHSYKLELELTSRGIPFEKRGGLKLTESAHIKDVLAFVRVLANPGDRLSWNRMLLQIERLGPKTAGRITDWLLEHDDPIAAMPRYAGRGKWRPGYDELTALLQKLACETAPGAVLAAILDHYRPVLERIYSDDYPRRLKDLDQLAALVGGYESLQAFLDDTALDPPEEGREAEAGGRLVLSTIHSAKGLEWDTVFVIHLADGRFPPAQAAFTDQMEEERRLFYVAVTRARQRLFLVYPRQVAGADRRPMPAPPSPFLNDIPADLLAGHQPASRPTSDEHQAVADRIGAMLGGRHTAKRPARDRAGGRAVGAVLKVGSTVRHPFFGKGRVEKKVGPATVHVFFPAHGTKILHLDYARLELVEE
ncbi:MAG TPA: ATP-dependent helicase, partial [Desulfobacterales bacterium]|nr:ATP-dependent helicase [Desulfobacterales bacterium]